MSTSTSNQSIAALQQIDRAAMQSRLRDLREQIGQLEKAAEILGSAQMEGPLQLVQRTCADLQRQAEALESGQWTAPTPFAYRRSYLVTVLSQDAIEFGSLADMARDMDEGDSVGTWELLALEGLDREMAREAMLAVGNDGSFFQLDEGDELDEVEPAADRPS